MPTYEYECKECKYAWEEYQSILDDPILVCEKCKKETATRLISGGTGFVLEGGCWAKDGYS